MEITNANAETSTAKCRRLLAELEQNLVTNLKEGKYAKSGGFVEYQEEVQKIRGRYESTAGLGVQVRLLFFYEQAVIFIPDPSQESVVQAFNRTFH